MIEISLFKFDSKTDYLPYYKTYTLERDSLKTINDLLDAINTIEKFGYLSGEAFFLRINNIFTSSDANLSDFDTNEFVLEPLSINRAINDLIIDTKDYQEKLNLLDTYMSDDEKASFIKDKIYMLEYYASNTLHFNPDYIGEHVVLLGLDIAKKDASLKDEIFALLECENGISNKSSLKYRILNYPIPVNTTAVDVSIEQYFDNFNIALYCALEESSFEYTIKQSSANYIELKSKHFDIPLSSQNLSYLMAGTILLEAMDNDADFLIVNDRKNLSLFDGKQKDIEKTMGREINLPILTQNEFMKLLEGEKDKANIGLASHKININFLD